MFKRTILIILDGWGKAPPGPSNAIDQAFTPFMDEISSNYPASQLLTHGQNVGLPDDQMGNSEVGHLNLGAGRIVYQDLLHINNLINENRLKDSTAIHQLVNYCKSNNKPCHLIGLVSKGGVHSHMDHLKALIEVLHNNGVKQIFIHVITDGRDNDPHSSLKEITELETFLQNKNASISSLIGRYYAMDRDKRWERIKKAYDLMLHGKCLCHEALNHMLF